MGQAAWASDGSEVENQVGLVRERTLSQGAGTSLLEAHAMLWIELALKRGLGRDWAFALVRR